MECLSAVPEMLGAPADDFRAMKWYAVYTCVRHEKRVAEQMEQRQLPSFLPLYRALHRWKDRQKEVELALFPGYVFVHLALRDRLRVLATKNLTTAEGGMLTGNAALLDQARVWSLHGMSRDAWKRYSSAGSWRYEVVCPGFKYNMTDIQAAIGLHQLRKLPEFHRRRREIAQRYTRAFQNVAELQTPPEAPGAGHAWHLYVLRLHLDRLRLTRDALLAELHHRRIGTSVHFIPVHLHAYYRDKYGYSPQDFPVAYAEYQRMFSLPCSPRMQDQDVEDVIEAVLEVVEAAASGSRAKPLASAAYSP